MFFYIFIFIIILCSKFLNDKMLLSISKTMENRFKLIYPHETVKSQDLYIIIEIDDFERITVKTAYSFSKTRRQREHERK